MNISSNTDLGRYRIKAPLGSGGMGEVYLAQDLSLKRPVAIKLLPARFTNDKERLRRFKREALAASSLNHPNIITVYEVGQVGDIHYIATEFIDGETLRQRMTRTRIGITELLDLTVQVLTALSAAHAAGIVHRDIKPENIMIRHDGYVKLLDFGLAKLVEDLPGQTMDTAASTLSVSDLSRDAVVGTLSYMSPEQLRQHKLDGRTDIWSLGVVLYEILADHKPFQGATDAKIITAILEREPRSLLESAPETPPRMSGIVMKMLRKDRDERYLNTKQLLDDIKEFSQGLDLTTKPEMPVKQEQGSRAPTLTAPVEFHTGQKLVDIKTELNKESSNANRIETASTSRPVSRNKKVAFILLTLAMLSVVCVYLFRRLNVSPARRQGKPPFQNIQTTETPYTSKAILAVISPDGNSLAYVERDNQKQSVWVRRLGATALTPIDEPGMLVPPGDLECYGLAFSPDGNFIYFTGMDKTDTGALYRVDISRGLVMKLVQDVDSAVALSPDGTRLAFIRYYPNQSKDDLVVANLDGTGEQTLATRTRPQFFTRGSGLAWSPDSRLIVCVTGSHLNGNNKGLVAFDSAGGEVAISPPNWTSISRFSWLADSSGLVVPAVKRGNGTAKQLWFIPYPAGEPRQITHDTNNYILVNLTADSKTICAVKSTVASDFYFVPGGKADQARKINSGRFGGYDLSLTPDGRILYVSNSSGNPDVWIMDADGKKETQLTFDANSDLYPTPSPDNQYIIFTSNRKGSYNLWRMDMDGKNLRQLTNGSDADDPHCSPDGKWVFYRGIDNSGKTALWKVSVDGGESVPMVNQPVQNPVVSPDGKYIAFDYWDAAESADKLAIMRFEGGDILKSFAISTNLFRWSPNGQAITYVDEQNGTSNIWSQPLDGGTPKKVTDFKEQEIYSFDWSKDGKALVCERGNEYRNVLLLKDTGE